MSDYSKIVVQLRGEIGEVIHTWVLYRHILAARTKEMTGDINNDMRNQNLWFLNSLGERLLNDIVARLSELSDEVSRKQITFSHACKALQKVGLTPKDNKVQRFRTFVEDHQFLEKRNNEISHKAFVAEWSKERAPIHIPYKKVIRAISLAVKVAKQIDEVMYGKIHSRFMWQALREKRYTSTMPPRALYMIAEHIRVPEKIRAQIILNEIHSGKFHQELIDVLVNGVKVQIYASKKWGAINLGGQLQVLPQYPLIAVQRIDGENIIVDPAWSQQSNVDSKEDLGK